MPRDLRLASSDQRSGRPALGASTAHGRVAYGALTDGGQEQILGSSKSQGWTVRDYVTDGQTRDVNPSATGHQLHFTSILPGGTDQKLYSAVVNGVTYSSPAAEVAYYRTRREELRGL